MTSLNLKISLLLGFCLILLSSYSFAQTGKITLNQDKKITTLLELKKELNKNDETSDSYKISIFFVFLSGAEAAQSKFRGSYNKWRTKLIFETPNYKILVGSYRTRLEADRALKDIKRKFPNAFIFKPKKDKN